MKAIYFILVLFLLTERCAADTLASDLPNIDSLPIDDSWLVLDVSESDQGIDWAWLQKDGINAYIAYPQSEAAELTMPDGETIELKPGKISALFLSPEVTELQFSLFDTDIAVNGTRIYLSYSPEAPLEQDTNLDYEIIELHTLLYETQFLLQTDEKIIRINITNDFIDFEYNPSNSPEYSAFCVQELSEPSGDGIGMSYSSIITWTCGDADLTFFIQETPPLATSMLSSTEVSYLGDDTPEFSRNSLTPKKKSGAANLFFIMLLSGTRFFIKRRKISGS